MAFDGSGVFLRLRSWIADATAGVKIRADFHDDEDNNFAAGLSNCICKDGQTTVTQNIPMNSKRIVALQDPVDPQDAATKHYADTKMPLDGSVPITGDVIIQSGDGSNSIFGDKGGKHRWEIVLGNATAEAGSDAGSDFELINYHDDGTLIGDVFFGTRSTGLMTVKADPTAALGIATKQLVDTKLPLAGGTITGGLTVNGELLAVQGLLRFTTASTGGYIQWTGGANYNVGGYAIWHSGNLAASTIVASARLAFAGDREYLIGAFAVVEPFPGAVMTSTWAAVDRIGIRWRYLQTLIGGTWFTVGYA